MKHLPAPAHRSLPSRLTLAGVTLSALLVACEARSVPHEGLRAEDFDAHPSGSLPAGWRIEATNPVAASALWEVRSDPRAASAPNLLVLQDTRGASGQTYNLCWNRDIAFANGRLTTRVLAQSGEEDQGGGPAWRIQDASNYYVARWNPLENNFRVYTVVDGKRTQLASAETDLDPSEWHTIEIVHVDSLIRCSLDDRLLLSVQDEAIPASGGIGLWTKADARTAFDDLQWASLP